MKTDVSQKNIASNIIPQKAAVCLFEMLVLTYHCKRCHTPKDHNMKLYRHTLHDIYIYIYIKSLTSYVLTYDVSVVSVHT